MNRILRGEDMKIFRSFQFQVCKDKNIFLVNGRLPEFNNLNEVNFSAQGR